MYVFSRFRSQKGFSLVELMVVVSIIGILASVAVPNFQRFAAKAKQAEAKTSLSALFTAERAFSSEWGSFFGDFRNIGYQPVGNIRYRHGFGATGNACPGGYVGAGVAAAGAAVNFNTSVAAVCTSFCAELTTPVAPGTVTAGDVTAASTFIAEARGDIDGDATVDTWTINEQKSIANTQDDILG
jgi:type IV pilus assembly protein PilA